MMDDKRVRSSIGRSGKDRERIGKGSRKDREGFGCVTEEDDANTLLVETRGGGPLFSVRSLDSNSPASTTTHSAHETYTK